MAGTPTVRKKLLGREIAFLREQARIDQERAARHIERKRTTLAQIEGGLVNISLGDLDRLLDFYSVTDETERELCREWRRTSRQPRNYWGAHRAVYSEDFRTFVEMEADCELLRTVATESIADWFQTPAYMDALFSVRKQQRAALEAIKTARIERQQVFTRAGGPELRVVMSESSFRRKVGSPEIMREQTEHILRMSELPNIKLQLQPYDYQPRSYFVTGRFALFRVPSTGMAGPLEYVCNVFEGSDRFFYNDDQVTVNDHESWFANLTADALTFKETREYIEKEILPGF